MKEDIALKTGFAGLWAVLAHYADNFTALVWLLVGFEICDYISGMYGAWLRNEISSKSAIEGFFKKIFYFFLVGVGFGIDYIIIEAKGMVGLEFNYPAIFGILSVCYLLSTEAISILENLAEIGIEVPFLSRFLKAFREKISENGGGKGE